MTKILEQVKNMRWLDMECQKERILLKAAGPGDVAHAVRDNVVKVFEKELKDAEKEMLKIFLDKKIPDTDAKVLVVDWETFIIDSIIKHLEEQKIRL